MSTQIVFIQGGGEDGYEADKALAASLQEILGKEYDVHYPELISDETAADFGWLQQIGKEISKASNGVILVGHSLGASMLLKYLTENSVNKTIAGIFLIATPFWNGSEDWQKGLKLKENFADRLSRDIPIFFYHCKDDEVAPFVQMNKYKERLTQGIFREQEKGGHQFNNDLSLVAKDIQSFQNSF